MDNTDLSPTNHHEMLQNLQSVLNELYREDVHYVADKILTRQTIMQDSVARFHEMVTADSTRLQAVEQTIEQTMQTLNAQIEVLAAERAKVQEFSSASPFDDEFDVDAYSRGANRRAQPAVPPGRQGLRPHGHHRVSVPHAAPWQRAPRHFCQAGPGTGTPAVPCAMAHPTNHLTVSVTHSLSSHRRVGIENRKYYKSFGHDQRGANV